MSVAAIEPPHATWVWQDVEGDAQPAAADGRRRDPGRVLPQGTAITVRADGPLARVALRWNQSPPVDALVLGDAWERSYGDLQWSGIRPHRPLPWYWAATSRSTGRTVGAGVRVRPGAMASWTVDPAGFTLWLDVRSGTRPVRLGGRALHAATVVELTADGGTSAFAGVSELVGRSAGTRCPSTARSSGRTTGTTRTASASMPTR
jgi:alpha-galactosidase